MSALSTSAQAADADSCAALIRARSMQLAHIHHAARQRRPTCALRRCTQENPDLCTRHHNHRLQGCPFDAPAPRGRGDDTSTSSDRRMAGSDADAEASDADASAGEPFAPAATPLSESARPVAAAAAASLGNGTVSETRQLPEPSHAGCSSSSRTASAQNCTVVRQLMLGSVFYMYTGARHERC